MPIPPAAQVQTVDHEFAFEYGGAIPRLEIAFESFGSLNSARDNLVLVLPAFSAHCHIRSSAADPSPGWWEKMVGPGLAIDTDRFFVVCSSNLGGCHGTSGPRSTDPRTGQDYGAHFPLVGIGDLVRAHLALLDALGINAAHAVIGGSMGAMQALESGLRHPGRTRRVIAVSGTDHTRPATAAIRHLGRKAIMLDPDFKGGHYGENLPRRGLGLARELGTTVVAEGVETEEERTKLTEIGCDLLQGFFFAKPRRLTRR